MSFLDSYFNFMGPFMYPKMITMEISFWVSNGVIQMVATKDSQWKQPVDWTSAGLSKIGSKRIVFIRHGESAWNEVFNRGFNLGFPGRLIRGVMQELSYITTPYSIFFDTPLNDLGIHQAQQLAKFLDDTNNTEAPGTGEIVSILRGDKPENSLIVSSNLRRALSTVAIALWKRIDKTKEKILIHSSCQEISRNVDCVASAPPGTVPSMEGSDSLNAAELMAHGSKYDAEGIFDGAYNSGQKPLNERGVERLEYFAQWAFTRAEETIIVGGHSLWFRNFFKAFLASKDEHPGKSCKMQNGACVAFTLNLGKTEKGYVQWIEPGSITPVYGGFELPKKTKKTQ